MSRSDVTWSTHRSWIIPANLQIKKKSSKIFQENRHRIQNNRCGRPSWWQWLSRILQVPATKYTFLGFKERLVSGYFVNPLSEIHTLGFSKIIWVPAILRTPQTKYTLFGFHDDLGFTYFADALSEIHTFGFPIIVWVFDITMFLRHLLSKTHTFGFLSH